MLLTSRDICALVISSQEEEVLGVLDLVAEEQEYGLEALLAAVDIVAQEEIVGLRGKTAHFKQTNEVGILAMDVAHDLDGGAEFDEGWLGEEDLAGGLADCGNLVVFETDRLVDLGRIADLE